MVEKRQQRRSGKAVTQTITQKAIGFITRRPTCTKMEAMR